MYVQHEKNVFDLLLLLLYRAMVHAVIIINYYISLIYRTYKFFSLKGHSVHLKRVFWNIDTIRPNSQFLFWLLYMAMICQHVHRLELRKFLTFCVARLPVKTRFNFKHAYPATHPLYQLIPRYIKG